MPNTVFLLTCASDSRLPPWAAPLDFALLHSKIKLVGFWNSNRDLPLAQLCLEYFKE